MLSFKGIPANNRYKAKKLKEKNEREDQNCCYRPRYVGLPLAVRFATRFFTVGFDWSPSRVKELNAGYDRTFEIETHELESSTHLSLTCSEDDIRDSNVFVITVPTPIDQNNQPDISLLISAKNGS